MLDIILLISTVIENKILVHPVLNIDNLFDVQLTRYRFRDQ